MADDKIHFLILTKDLIQQGLDEGVIVMVKGEPYWKGFFILESRKLEV